MEEQSADSGQQTVGTPSAIRVDVGVGHGTVVLLIRRGGEVLPIEFDPDTADAIGLNLIRNATGARMEILRAAREAEEEAKSRPALVLARN